MAIDPVKYWQFKAETKRHIAELRKKLHDVSVNGGGGSGGGGGTDIDLSDYATMRWVESQGYAKSADLSGYALASQIPTKVSQLTNDANYLKSSSTPLAFSVYALNVRSSLSLRAYSSSAPDDAPDIGFFSYSNEEIGRIYKPAGIERFYVRFGAAKPSYSLAFTSDLEPIAERIDNLQEHIDSMFVIDDNGYIKAKKSIYSIGSISAKGIGSGSSGGGSGTSYSRLDSWTDYNADKATYVLSALLGNDLDTRLKTVENAGYATEIWVTGKLSGYALTSQIPTNNNQLTNGAGYITGIDSSMVTKALGYTPLSTTGTAANSNQLGGRTADQYMVSRFSPSHKDINQTLDVGIYRFDTLNNPPKLADGTVVGTNYGNLMVIRGGGQDTLTQIYFNWDNQATYIRSGNTSGVAANGGITARSWNEIAYRSHIPTTAAQIGALGATDTAVNSAKLGGQLPAFYATTTITTALAKAIEDDEKILGDLGIAVDNLENAGYITDAALQPYAKTSDLSVYAKRTEIPTNNNQLSNGAGYVTGTQLNSYGYATEAWVNSQLTNKIPTNNSQLTNGEGYIKGIDSVMVIEALNYTPFNAADFTKSNIKNTLGIADWALGSTKPSYSWSEVQSRPTALSQFSNDVGYITASAKVSSAYSADESNKLLAQYLAKSDANTLGIGAVFGWVNKSTGASNIPTAGNLISFEDNSQCATQILSKYDGTATYTRIKKQSDKTWSDWVQLAYKSHIPTRLSQLTDDMVAGHYLPLIGGSLSGALSVPSITIGGITISVGTDGALQINGNMYATGSITAKKIA